jgi:hypothetical protein
MEYTEEILKRLLQELIDKREYFYSDEVDYDDDDWRKGVDKCDKEIKVIKFIYCCEIVLMFYNVPQIRLVAIKLKYKL